MIQKATAINFRQNLGDFLNGVQYRHDSILITKAGKPVAAVVDVELFEKIRFMKDTFERFSLELSKAYQSVDPAVADQEIDEALESIKDRKEK